MRPLFARSNPGSKKSITVTRTSDFELKLYAQDEGEEEPRHYRTFGISVCHVCDRAHGEDTHVNTVYSTHISPSQQGVAGALEAVGYNKEGKNASNTHSVQLAVSLTSQGLINLESVTVKYDEHTLVEKKSMCKHRQLSEHVS